MKAIELFAGAGGLALGVSGAGFKPVAVIERDHWCCDTIRENRRNGVEALRAWPDPTEGDVRDYDFKKFEGRVQLVTGGPPCQPFSLGGKHQAHKDDRDMWPEAVRAVRDVKPEAFVFENVKGLTRPAFATYLEYIVLQLRFPGIARKLGETVGDHLARLERHATSHKRAALEYDVVFRVLNAADYGVPQRRERVVFVGFRRDLSLAWSFPDPTHSRAALLVAQAKGEYWERHEVPRRERHALNVMPGPWDMFRTGAKPWLTVRDALADLPDPRSSLRRRIPNHDFRAGARQYPGHTGSPLDMPAKTLKAGVHGVPGGENMILLPSGDVRYFTVRESARIQTFPDSFRFPGAWSEAMRQIGNAVPVTLASALARSLASTLRG